MNKVLKKISATKLAVALALAVAGLAAPASAAVTSGLHVTSIEQTDTGSVFVRFDGNLSGASCSNRNLVYFDGTTAAGKNFLSTLTAALLGAKTVNVDFTTAACRTNTHTLKWINFY